MSFSSTSSSPSTPFRKNKKNPPIAIPRQSKNATTTTTTTTTSTTAAAAALEYNNVSDSSSPPSFHTPIASSFSSLSSSPFQHKRLPSSDLSREEKDRLLRRHLVTPNGTRSSAPASQSRSPSNRLPATRDKDSRSSGTSPAPDNVRNSSSGVAEDDGDAIFSTSHKLVGGAIVRDIYKWHEDNSLDNAARKLRSKSSSDLQAFLKHEVEAAAAAENVNLPQPPSSGASSNAAGDAPYGAYTHVPPAVNASSIRAPGGFRRHFVQRQARTEGKAPRQVTRNFIDFLTLYGHFAGDYFQDDDSENEEDVILPYPEPGLPPVPSYSARTPLLPARRASETEGGTASVRKVVFLLLKSFIGTGVLFLPKAFYNGGMLFSIIVLAFISWLCLYAMLLLVECKSAVRGSFGDIGGALYGPRMRTLILASIAISQVGFCCAYFIFVAQNMRDLVASVTRCKVQLPDHYYILFQLVLYIPTSMVRKIHKLGVLALIADVFILFGLGYLYYYDFKVLAELGVGKIKHFNSEAVSLFIGTAIFTFEGIGLVIPIAESMKEPEKFPMVLSRTMAAVTVVFVSAGALSYAAFGDEVETVVLLNLPSNDAVVETVQLLYSFAIMFSVPLMLYPAVRILEAGLWVRTGKASNTVKWQKNGLRASLCLVAAAVSWFGASSLDRFVALIGAFACVPLSFIYPAMLHLKAIAKTRSEKVKDYVLFVFGVLVMIFVAAQTITNWIAGGSEPPFDRCAPNHGGGQ